MSLGYGPSGTGPVTTETSSTNIQHKRNRRLRLLPRCNARDNRRSPTKQQFSKSSLNLRRDKDGSFVCNNCGMFSTHPGRVPSVSLSFYYNFNQRTRPTHFPPIPSPSPKPTTESPVPVKPMHSQVIPTPTASSSPKPPHIGTWPGDGRCDGTGGSDACSGCPTSNNALQAACPTTEDDSADQPVKDDPVPSELHSDPPKI